jgi:hypothetical protein
LSYPEAPSFPRCQLRQISPCSPHASLHAHQPTCVAWVTLFRYVPQVGLSDFHLQPGHTSISSRAPFHGRPTSLLSCCPGSIGHEFAINRVVRLGRTGEFHPRAPSVAAPALLEACGFSVCLLENWQFSSCWSGGPTRPFGQCVFAVGGLP